MTIKTSTERRLALGFLSNWVGKLSGSAITFVQVWVFTRYWAPALYGEWTIVNTIPTYLAFSNIGFGSVAGNDMTMRESAGDRDGALAVFQSCWWLIACICGAVALLLGPLLYLVPVERILRLHTITGSDARWIVFYLGLSVLLGQFEQLLSAAYTCVGRYPWGSFLKSMMSLVAFIAMMVPVAMHRGPRSVALVYAVANAIGTLFLAVMVRRDIPWLRFGWRYAQWTEIRRMTKPAIAFMGFPIGNAFNLQGTLIAVQYALGPLAVVVFNTARIVSRVALQMVQMVNSTFWPEFSMAYGAGNFALVRTLHRRACQLALVIAALLIVAMMGFGPWFLTHWTHGQAPPSKGLLAVLLIGVLLYSLWSTSATLQAATNQHSRLAAYYIVGTGITVVITYFVARTHGLIGAAAALIVSELIMNTYVLPQSLRLTSDTWTAFLRSQFEIPVAVRPSAMLRRVLRTAQPAQEDQ